MLNICLLNGILEKLEDSPINLSDWERERGLSVMKEDFLAIADGVWYDYTYNHYEE